MRSRRGSSVLRGLPVSSRIPEPTAEAFAALPGTGVGVCRTAGRLFSETLRVFVNKKANCFFYVYWRTSLYRWMDAFAAFRWETCSVAGPAYRPLRLRLAMRSKVFVYTSTVPSNSTISRALRSSAPSFCSLSEEIPTHSKWPEFAPIARRERSREQAIGWFRCTPHLRSSSPADADEAAANKA